jgi:hypothetical protein
MDDCFGRMDTKTRVCCITMTLSVLFITILTALSFGSIEPTEYGILYSKLYKDIDGENV